MDKQEVKTYYSTIEISVFRTAVLVLVSSSRKDILEDLPKVYNNFNIKKEILQRDTKLIEKIWENDGEPEYMPPGETLRLCNPSGDVIMIFCADSIADINEELVVHETHHAATYLCEFRGIEDEECEAYVQEYLFNQILNKMDTWNNEHKEKIDETSNYSK